MSRRVLVASLLIAIVVSPHIQAQEDPPRYVEDPVTPKYQSMSAKELRAAVSIRPSRSYAMFGYNVPEIVVQLPEIDNSVYAKTKFEDPVLLDEQGEIVEYEREDGIYDHDTHSDEVRMTTAEGGPVQFAVAKGTATIRYPVAITTHRVAVTDEPELAELGLTVEGREIRMNLDDDVPEEASFTPITTLRAFDESGRMIEREGGWSGGTVDGVDYRSYEFRADIATVEIDRVDEWVGLSIEYELPSAPMRKDALAGTLPDPDPLIASTKPGTVSITVIDLIPPSVLGYAADLPREEIAARLGEIGYRSIDDDAMIRAATEGNADAVRLLLAAGISADARVGDQTPILRAASFAGTDVIVLLIQAGADVNARDEVNATSLIRLANRCSTMDVMEAARALVDAGIDVNAKANGSATGLMMADVLQCSDLASMLREAGAEEWR